MMVTWPFYPFYPFIVKYYLTALLFYYWYSDIIAITGIQRIWYVWWRWYLLIFPIVLCVLPWSDDGLMMHIFHSIHCWHYCIYWHIPLPVVPDAKVVVLFTKVMWYYRNPSNWLFPDPVMMMIFSPACYDYQYCWWFLEWWKVGITVLLLSCWPPHCTAIGIVILFHSPVLMTGDVMYSVMLLLFMPWWRGRGVNLPHGDINDVVIPIDDMIIVFKW